MNYIITADEHLRTDLPLCRTDPDWIVTQKTVLQFIINTCNEKNADLIIAGDLFDVPKVSPIILNIFLKSIRQLSTTCYVIAGNHSLLWHNQDNLIESTIGALAALPPEQYHIKYLPCNDMSENGIFEHSVQLTDDITLVHTLTFPTENDIPYGFKAQTAKRLLEKYPTKYIITGDNHKHFIYKQDDRMVINPGCTTIQTADMIDYDPIIYHLTDTTIKEIKLPNPQKYLTNNYLKQQEIRDKRIQAFVDVIKKNNKQSTLSFEDNLQKTLLQNTIDSDTHKIIDEIKQEIGENDEY